MEHDVEQASGKPLSVYEMDYDPFASCEIDEDIDDEGGQRGPRMDVMATIGYVSKADDRPALQRIDDLFEALAPRRRVLVGIMDFLLEIRCADALRQKVEELQSFDRSVYSGYDYSLLLEEAGAIEKVGEDGSAFAGEAEQRPDIVEIDGSRFYRPVDGRRVFWVATDEGRAYLEKDDSWSRLVRLSREEPRYRPVYERLLRYCDDGVGRKVEELERLVGGDPAERSPRKHCSFFLKRLEDCGALSWAGGWRTTELGRQALVRVFSERFERGSES